MSLPGKLRNYRPPIPWIIGALLLCAFAFYLATQIEQWLRLARDPAPTMNDEQVPGHLAQPDLQRLETLFGSAAPAPGYAPTAATGLTLRGSFVHAEPQRSSAIIQLEGQPPRLYWQGETLDNGLTLHNVYPDRVEILRNGQVETLHFPQVRSTDYIPEEPVQPTAPDEQPYAEPQAPDTQAMQQQMDALRQQLEEAVNPTDAAPSNDPPMEDD